MGDDPLGFESFTKIWLNEMLKIQELNDKLESYTLDGIKNIELDELNLSSKNIELDELNLSS
ncbi:hypothetical protein P3675_27595, partial [Vibrio parahaemolyticus]|nr:hypothetical protein [Vibrio parahaemolyticus]